MANYFGGTALAAALAIDRRRGRQIRSLKAFAAGYNRVNPGEGIL